MILRNLGVLVLIRGKIGFTRSFFPFDLLRLSVKVCFGSAIVIFRRTACNKGQEIQMLSEAKDKFKIT